MKKLIIPVIIVTALVLTLPVSAADANIDADILAAYIDGSGARDLCTMTAVGAVLCNRVNSDSFTDSLTANGASLGILPASSPTPMARYAARLVLDGVDPTFGALHAYAPDNVPDGVYVTLVTDAFAFGR